MFTHTPIEGYVDLDAAITDGLRFYTTPSGVKYPSITTVLGNTADKAWLESWRQWLGEEAAAIETARCSTRGTAVHAMSEMYLNNDPAYKEGFDAEYIKRFNQMRPYLNKIDNILGLELALYSDMLGIAGRVDCVAEYDGVLSIIDFKTSNGNKSTDMIGDYFLQCTAYSLMLEEMFGILIEQIVVMMTVERGISALVWKKPRDAYVAPLCQRVKTFKKQLAAGTILPS